MIKKLIIRILIFSTPFFLLSYPMDVLLSHELSKSHDFRGEFEVMNDIYRGKIECDIAVYGNSRAWVQFDPHILEDSLGLKCYNFGIDGHGFWLQYFRHLEFLKNNKKPKYIIVSVDVFNLRKVKELYNFEQFMPYMLWNKDIFEFTSSYIGFSKLDYYIPLIRYFGKTTAIKGAWVRYFTSDNGEFRNNGYKAIEAEWDEDYDKVFAQTKKRSIQVDSSTVNLFERFLKECQVSEIKVIMVNAPMYIQGQELVSNRQFIIGLHKEFSKKYNIEFLDYSNNEICMQKKYFADVFHLNKAGSELFSSVLASDLRKMNLVNVYGFQKDNTP